MSLLLCCMLANQPKEVSLFLVTSSSCWDNLAKAVQSHYIRGPSLKQHNFISKTYANNSKQHIHDRNTGPKHKNVNLMV